MRILSACRLALLIAALCAPARAQTNCLVQMIRPPDTQASGRFSTSLDLNGEWAVVTSRVPAADNSSQMVVRIYRRNADQQWDLHQQLEELFDLPSNDYAQTARLDGSLLVVGDPSDDEVAMNAGAVHVYAWSAEAARWEWEAKLFAPDGGAAGECFGIRLSISGQSFVAGSYPSHSGKAHVFDRLQPGVWSCSGSFASPTPGIFDRFASQVEISGNHLAVGAWSHEYEHNHDPAVGYSWHGAVHMYRRASATAPWQPQTTLVGIESEVGFGQALALQGDRLVVGTAANDGGQQQYSLSLRLFQFDRRREHWEFLSSQLSTAGSSQARERRWVDLDGESIVRAENWPWHNKLGTIQVFSHHNATGMVLASQHYPRYPGAYYIPNGDGFGTTVAIDDGWYMTGDPANDDIISDGGVVYVYQLNGVDCNRNGTCDATDITSGASRDDDRDGVPDECQLIPGDINGDGVVDQIDLLALLEAWGPCPPAPATCPADIHPLGEGDGVVNTDDLLLLLGHWS